MRRVIVAAAVAACLTGCAASVKTQDRLGSVDENPRIVLMPPDIRYYRISTGGVVQPNKEWTEAAQANFTAAALEFAEGIGADLKVLDRYNLGPEEIQYETLHAAVGEAVKKHHFGRRKLPGKANVFDWSLGEGVQTIGRNHDADYALFVYYRDYQESVGRMATGAVAAAVGVAVEQGSESGFASLVDLETGDIVWFNVVRAGSGELRNEPGAAKAVETLFKDIPER